MYIYHIVPILYVAAMLIYENSRQNEPQLMKTIYFGFGATIIVDILLVITFYLAKGNYEVGARSLRLTLLGNMFIIISFISLMTSYTGVDNRIACTVHLLLFAVGSTLIYWRNLRIQVQIFKLDPLLFQPSSNQIQHTGYLLELFAKRLSIYLLLQLICITAIWCSNYFYIYQGAILFLFAIMNLEMLYQVRIAQGKDTIKYRQELIESSVIGLFLGLTVILDGALVLSLESNLYGASIWYICISSPLLIFLNVHNGLLAAYSHVKLEKQIQNNFRSFELVMTNQILYTVLHVNIDV
eukprot:NODE_252_length_12846_cov_0.309485.p3 type:complete len:297 gc:universal NODE_252_length_12846_cov_0.309485:9612-10502(+)